LDAPIVAALIALFGVAVGLVGRDIVMALVIARQKRSHEIEDKQEARASTRRGLVTAYSDPLFDAVRSLRSRLDELVRKNGQATYLLANTTKNHYIEYKRISTLYRLAALLGWIRAFRRERSYLDPEQGTEPDATDTAIDGIVHALADGQSVEELRLDEFMNLWRVSRDAISDMPNRGWRLRLMACFKKWWMISHPERVRSRCAAKDRIGTKVRADNSVRHKIDIPTALVDATIEQVCAFLGIREAYIYRDWQHAIGDMMISEVPGGIRRFEVIGFGEFEDRYLIAHNADHQNSDRRWLDRLETLFHDLDMRMTGIFDARREQLRALHKGLVALEAHLQKKREELNNTELQPTHRESQ
jgi:hypothetical protein